MMDAKALVSKGESETLEFKESLALKDEIGEGVSALSNTSGGMILVGVNDRSEIVGVQTGKKTLEDLANYIKTNTDNHVFPKISLIEAEGKDVVVIEVKVSDELPVFFKGKAYTRVGKSRHRLSASEIRKMAKESGKMVYWDEQVCEGASLEDIDGGAVNKFMERYKYVNKTAIEGSDRELLKALKCIKDMSGKAHITNAGILLFGREPTKFFLTDYVTVVRYPGRDKAETYLDIKDFNGNLFSIVDSVNEYITQHIQEISQVVKGQIARETMPQYPYFAIRELITNAVVHRDYTNAGSRIIIRMFRDRLEFSSPGSLPGNITPENIVDEQYSRNPVISEAFSRIRYIEKLGEGWDKIIASVKGHPLISRMPEIRDTGNTVIATLFGPDEELLEKGLAMRWDDLGRFGTIINQLNERQISALRHVIKEKQITREEYMKLCTVTKSTAHRDLRELVDKGVLSAKSKGRATYYVSAIG